MHTVLKDGSDITCKDYVAKSVLSSLMTEVPLGTLRTDTAYFAAIGDDCVKVAFFLSFVSMMRKRDPEFDRCSYVDSTPLPNEIAELVRNAYSRHGKGGSSGQTRLVLILDEKTGLPVWFIVFSGNVLDENTVRKIEADLKATLDITIGSVVLDSLYALKEFLEEFPI